MAIEYRGITDESFADWRGAVRRGFNQHVHPDDIERARRDRVEMDRIFGAFDGEQLVGTGGADSHMLTLPGGSQLPVGGIAYITTASTHRRRGVMTGMMERLLNEAREREEAVAILWAEQSAIYGRFGFGMSTLTETWRIDPRHGAFSGPPGGDGAVRFVDAEEASRKFPGVYERVRLARAGFLDRTPSRWRYNFFDEERVRGGWSAFFYVAYERDGQIDGYAVYRTKSRGFMEGMDLAVKECMAATDEAHAALWRFLLDVDLTRSLTAPMRPPDDSLWWLLADPRHLVRRVADGLWTHLLNPAKALAARSYGHEGRLTLELHPPRAASRSPVTLELEVTPEGATCRPVGGPADLAMGDAEIGALFLGGVAPQDLARAGRIEERRPGALRTAGLMFPATPAPWCAHYF